MPWEAFGCAPKSQPYWRTALNSSPRTTKAGEGRDGAIARIPRSYRDAYHAAKPARQGRWSGVTTHAHLPPRASRATPLRCCILGKCADDMPQQLVPTCPDRCMLRTPLVIATTASCRQKEHVLAKRTHRTLRERKNWYPIPGPNAGFAEHWGPSTMSISIHPWYSRCLDRPLLEVQMPKTRDLPSDHQPNAPGQTLLDSSATSGSRTHG